MNGKEFLKFEEALESWLEEESKQFNDTPKTKFFNGKVIVYIDSPIGEFPAAEINPNNGDVFGIFPLRPSDKKLGNVFEGTGHA